MGLQESFFGEEKSFDIPTEVSDDITREDSKRVVGLRIVLLPCAVLGIAIIAIILSVPLLLFAPKRLWNERPKMYDKETKRRIVKPEPGENPYEKTLIRK